jgi:hypothetical protein
VIDVTMKLGYRSWEATLKKQNITLLSLLAVTVSACALQAGGPRISDHVWLSVGTQTRQPTDDPTDPGYIPPACVDADHNNDIDKCTTAMITLIDVKWGHFHDQLMNATTNFHFASDVGLMGIGTAGAFAAGGASQILSAISASITGLRASVDQDLLYSHTIGTILLQMQADRAAMRQRIEARLIATDAHNNKQPIPSDDEDRTTQKLAIPYSGMADAADDLFNYARAGTWDYALVSVQKSAAQSPGNPPNTTTQALKAPVSNPVVANPPQAQPAAPPH